jgi:hypothetical protein
LTPVEAQQVLLMRALWQFLLASFTLVLAAACKSDSRVPPQPSPESPPPPIPEVTQQHSDPPAPEGTDLNWDLRRRVLDEEISSLGSEHPWAGHYATAVTTDTYFAVTVAPRAGYTKALVGWTANIFESGRVRSLEDRITLVPTYFDLDPPLGRSPEDLWPVRWGDHTYLLESDEMIPFCNAVNSGDPVGTFWFSGFLLRDREFWVDRRPEKRPELPVQFERFIFDEPLVARVAQTLSARRVVLDVGSAQGVFETMPFFGDASSGGLFVVHKVLETTCEASCTATEHFREPHIGQSISSRRPPQDSTEDR